MLALVAALRQEIAPCLKELDVHETLSQGPIHITRTRNHLSEIVLIYGGGGRQAVAAAVLALAHVSITRVVSFGFAGGVSPLAACGHLVIASEVLKNGEEGTPTQTDPSLAEHLLEGARRASLTHHHGPILTVGKVLARPEEKAFLGSKHRALAVDMESYWLAEWAHRMKIPFGAVRAIFDPVEMPLNTPPEITLRPWRVLRYPDLWSQIPTLMTHLKKAQAALTDFAASC